VLLLHTDEVLVSTHLEAETAISIDSRGNLIGYFQVSEPHGTRSFVFIVFDIGVVEKFLVVSVILNSQFSELDHRFADLVV